MAESADQERFDRLKLLDTLMRNNFGLIQLADRKAQTLLRLAMGLFMIAFIGVPPTVVALKRFLAEGGWMAAVFVGVVVLYTVCATCLLVAVMHIVGAIRPRIESRADLRSELFHATIAAMEPDEFRAMIDRYGYEETVEDLIRQVYSTSVIADHKYRKVNRAITWMLSGGLFGVIFALILLVSVGLT